MHRPVATPSPVPPLVGRAHHLRILGDAFAACCEGRGRVVSLAGDAGIGKTRLADEFTRSVRDRARTMIGRAWAVEGTAPFAVWLAAFEPYLRGIGEEALHALLRERPTLGKLLAHTDHARSNADDARFRGLQDPEERRLVTFGHIKDFVLSLAADGPLVLMLDDIHFADPASLELLHFVARHIEGHRILIVATYRVESRASCGRLGTCIASLEREGVARELRLEPLDASESAELAQHCLGSPLPTVDFAAALYRKTRGNPLFVREVLALLAPRGASAGGALDLERIVPSSVVALVEERLGRQSAEAQQLARIAAVSGDHVPHWLLERIARPSAHGERFVTGIEELVRARFLEESYVRGQLVYRFAHPLLHETIYGGMSAARRTALHEAIGEALLENVRSDEVDPAALARHLGASARSRTRRQALPYLLASGERALALYANNEAVAALERARAIAGESDDAEVREAVLVRLGKGYERLGRFAEAIGAWTEALPVARDNLSAAALFRRMGRVRWQMGDEQRAIEHYREGLALAGDAAHLEVAKLRQELSIAWQRLGESERAIDQAQQAAAIARAVNAPELVASSYASLLTSYGVRGDITRAIRYGERVFAVGSERDASVPRWLADVTLGGLHRIRGEHALAAHHLRRSIALAEGMHAPSLRLWPLTIFAELCWLNGEWDRALELGEQAVTIGKSASEGALLPRSLAIAAILLRLRGDDTRSRAYLHEAITIVRTFKKQEVRVRTAVMGAQAYLSSLDGAFDAACDIGAALLAHVDAHGEYPHYVLHPSALPLFAVTAVRAGRRETALDALQRLKMLAERCDNRPAAAASLHAAALLGFAEGGTSAIDDAVSAIDLFTSIGRPYDAAIVRTDLAAMFERGARRAEAVEALRAAHGAFAHLGALANVRDTASRLAVLGAPVQPAPDRRPHPETLSRREREIASLIGDELSNREIAERLGISRLTAETHVRNMLRKLALRSRVEIRRYALENELL